MLLEYLISFSMACEPPASNNYSNGVNYNKQ